MMELIIINTQMSETHQVCELLTSFTGRTGFMMMWLKAEKGDKLKVKDILDAAKKKYEYTEKYSHDS